MTSNGMINGNACQLFRAQNGHFPGPTVLKQVLNELRTLFERISLSMINACQTVSYSTREAGF
jgi:hypothetical protein